MPKPDAPVYTRAELDQAIAVAVRRIVAVMEARGETVAVDAVYRAVAEVGVPQAEDDPEPACGCSVPPGAAHTCPPPKREVNPPW